MALFAGFVFAQKYDPLTGEEIKIKKFDPLTGDAIEENKPNIKNENIIKKIKSGERFFTPLKKLFESKSERSRFGIKGFYKS